MTRLQRSTVVSLSRKGGMRPKPKLTALKMKESSSPMYHAMIKCGRLRGELLADGTGLGRGLAVADGAVGFEESFAQRQ